MVSIKPAVSCARPCANGFSSSRSATSASFRRPDDSSLRLPLLSSLPAGGGASSARISGESTRRLVVVDTDRQGSWSCAGGGSYPGHKPYSLVGPASHPARMSTNVDRLRCWRGWRHDTSKNTGWGLPAFLSHICPAEGGGSTERASCGLTRREEQHQDRKQVGQHIEEKRRDVDACRL